MGKPYSLDLRERAVRSVITGGLSCRRAAAVYAVAISTVIHWVQRWHEEGNVAAKPMGGDHSSRLRAEDRAWLLQRIATKPDLTLEELRAELKTRGMSVGYGTVWRFFDAQGISFKKNRSCRRTRAA